jgi:hypothetical protein
VHFVHLHLGGFHPDLVCYWADLIVGEALECVRRAGTLAAWRAQPSIAPTPWPTTSSTAMPRRTALT